MDKIYNESWKIGDIEIKNKIVLAPMAGITNKAFLTTAKEFGAGLVVTEMISDKGIEHRNKKTLEMMDFEGVPHPLSMQIFGGEVDTLVEAAKFVEANTVADIIDINMGCPVPKVTKNEAGSRLLLDPDKVYDVVSAVSKAISRPLTVKIRIGWDDDHLFAVENAKAIEAGGGAAVSMHARTKAQAYTGNAQENWHWLKKLTDNVNIPVIGNGDVKTPEDAKRMIDETGVTAVMMGRAALGNPWILHRTEHYLRTGELLAEPTVAEKMEIAKLHLARLVELKGDNLASREFRQHAAYYLKGASRAAKVKVAVNQAESQAEIITILDNFVSGIK
ncbi:tRNA-dihydrouridine synthase B [Lactococcus cremoris subsp. cremoris UC509.9]|nr:tRNA dihydrouridine synthase B [Lactococcus cremoris subsp. cremoris A76]AFW92363.1 tRNA-dihydrouridine synthase B [Lactococcus cremoris subsp. cremoris UC509.9]KZK08075.1 tRNA dihydrouridine synthase B [Lactococcus cremoris]KZK09724.1 tRNA dihydrouridine synthase B [Lactococcus cremoris]KZK50209.1 tRNA dihydrouridine synthase B [Lactococcus cremoris]